MICRISIQLPYPPSSNAYWRSTKGGRIYVSEEAIAYKRLVEDRFILLGTMPVAGRYQMEVTAFPPSAACDLGNCLKVLEDALEFHAFMNDKLANRILLVRKNVERTEDEAVVCVEVLGSSFATRDEVNEARLKRVKTAAKRRKTIAAKKLAAHPWRVTESKFR